MRPISRTSRDRKSTRLNSSHQIISYAVFCLKKKKKGNTVPALAKVILQALILWRAERVPLHVRAHHASPSTAQLLHASIIAATHLTHFFFFFNDTTTPEIYTLSLHDALPISTRHERLGLGGQVEPVEVEPAHAADLQDVARSEEHTSELQSPDHLVCRLLLEKKKERKYRAGLSQSDSSGLDSLASRARAATRPCTSRQPLHSTAPTRLYYRGHSPHSLLFFF